MVSTHLLRILFVIVIAVKIEATNTRLLLMMWLPSTEANSTKCSILQLLYAHVPSHVDPHALQNLPQLPLLFMWIF